MYRALPALALLVLSFHSSPTYAQQPKVSCVATNHEVSHVEKVAEKHFRVTTVDDWWVDCAITRDGKELHRETLPLPHPCDFSAAMIAIEEFRTKRAGELIRRKR